MKKDTNSLFYISRNFVEFGGFTASEIAGFSKRGILSDNDYVRSAEGRDWLPVKTWLTSDEPAAETPAAPAKPAPRKRSTPAAKASKKAA